MQGANNSISIKKFIPIVVFLSSIGFFSSDLYLPSLPIILKSLKTNITGVQFTLSFYFISFSLSQLFFGPYSDKYGRKNAVYLGLAITIPGLIICMLAPNIWALIFGRMIQGFGLGSCITIARAMLRDVFSGSRMAYYSSFIAIGYSFFMAIVPLLGGYIQKYFGWRADFLVLLALTAIAILLVKFWLIETHTNKNPDALKPKVLVKSYFHILKNPMFLSYVGCTTLTMISMIAYFTASPFILESRLGLSPIQYGWSLFFIAFGLLIGGLLNAYCVKRIGRHRTLRIGVYGQILAGSCMLIPALFGMLNPAVILLPMLIFFLSAALTYPQAFAGGLFPFKENIGSASALFGSFQMLGGFFGSYLITLTHAKTQLPFSIILTTCGIGAFLLQFCAYKLYQKHFPA
ncbi:MAG: multidrug effflux MFS transporter [Simkaniaceae bacterium]|nr:multidrug effflux MFS transporter [Simkaniaceae bacterium]